MKILSKRLLSIVMAAVLLITGLCLNLFTATVSAVGYQSGDIVTLGSYPQTKVSNILTVAILNSLVPDANGDVSLLGTKYRRVYFTQYTPITPGGASNADNSYQDDNGYTVNTVYWFKYEPIEWRILSNTNGELFVMAEKILDSKAYNQEAAAVTWETCSLRNRLNNDFYNTAFTTSEKQQIMTSSLTNSRNLLYGTGGGNSTSDKLFLLSYADAVKSSYGFNWWFNNADKARMGQGTDYSKSSGLNAHLDSQYAGNGSWWLRSPGSSRENAGLITYNGSVDYSGSNTGRTDTGIRPALRMKLNTGVLISSITLSQSSATMKIGETLLLTAAVSPADAADTSVAWSSSKPEVATAVLSTGFIAAVGIGTAAITCTAKDGSGKKATCTVKVIPAVPDTFVVASAGSTSIVISWKAVLGATGYEVYRYSPVFDKYMLVKITTSTSFVNTGLSSGKTYSYKVRAFKYVGLTKYSSDFTAEKSAAPA